MQVKQFENKLILLCLVVIPILQSFISKFTVSISIPSFKHIDEFALLFLTIPALNGFKRMLTRKHWNHIPVYFAGYMSLGLISSYLNGVQLQQSLMQVIIAIKLLYVLFVIVGCNDGCSLFKGYLKIGKFILIISFFLIVWQFAFSSSYDSVFANGFHMGTMLISINEKVARGAGVFTHPGQMAVFSVSLVIPLFFICLSQQKETIDNAKFWLVASIIALITTFSRLEITATIIAISITVFYTMTGRNRVLKYYMVALFIGSVIFLSYPWILFSYHYYFSGDLMNVVDPRFVFTIKGIAIANDFFPFGSGLGTYGGFVAALYDSPVYLDYGFYQYSWYLQSHFLADTYWAHILGETGYFGILLYILMLGSIIVISMRYQRTDGDTTNMAKIVMSLVFFISMNSFATPDLVSVLSLSQCLIPLGCLYGLSNLNHKFC